MRDILANPQVSITIDSRDVVNPFKNEGVMIQGDAEVLEEELGKVIPEEMGIALDVFREKFVDVVFIQLKFIASGFYRFQRLVHIKRIVGFDFGRFAILVEVQLRAGVVDVPSADPFPPASHVENGIVNPE